MPTTTHHRVVALSMPVVYTLDGDYDPNGLIFAPAAHKPLLDWARDRFEDGDRLLPRLHHRRQRAQLVVDGLERLELMLDRLLHGPDEDQELLAELLRRERAGEYDEPQDRLGHGARRRSARAGAVQLNVQSTVDELRVALADLGDSDGLSCWGPSGTTPGTSADDATEGGAAPEAPHRLLLLSSEQRAEWRRHWQEQGRLLDRAIERWFAEVDADPDRAFNPTTLAKATAPRNPAARLNEDRVRHLLLNDHRAPVDQLGVDAPPYDRFNPMKPLRLVEPLVLRAHLDEQISVEVQNLIEDRRVGFHVQGDGLAASSGRGVRHADGSHIGANPDTTIGYRERRTFRYAARHEGVWPINDLADVRGSEQGSNVHGLFGALVVEPPGTRWRDPETGEDLTGAPYGPGLYADILVAEGEPVGTPEHQAFVDFHSDTVPRSFREFTVFIHDEPEIHSGLHTTGEHTVMPLSYRAEPMHPRLPHRMRRHAERTPAHPAPDQVGVDRTAVKWQLGDELEEQFWTARTPDGRWLEQVAGEEQHHSSWLFGEPATPVLRAYRGDPARIRLVHAGVKETHVFHLHVHQWRAVANDVAAPSVWGTDAAGRAKPKGSQLLDSITISPQTAFTIDPLYGSGSRQHLFGDVIWHCHLYPHFHHGMWGLWRSFDRLVDGTRAYPDGTPCPRLHFLPGREPDRPEPGHPGFPWFIDGEFPMKAPPPPAPTPELMGGRRLLLGMAPHSPLELAAMPPGTRDGSTPGAVFVDLDRDAADWNEAAGLPAPRLVSYDVEVSTENVAYNVDGWHDPRGHRYRLLSARITERGADGTQHEVASEVFEPDGTNPEPLFPRANHGDIVELRLHNALTSVPADAFDLGQAPVECGLHVHLVKFDVLAADGSSTGWNYLSGASCREAVGADHPGQQRTVSLHRWVVDEEFGPCFFHDHLLANYRQKHGLFSALVAEPHGSQWHRADDQDVVAWGNAQAVVVPPAVAGLPPYREACIGVGDFVPLLNRGGRALNPPGSLSGDDDPGSMGVNYRSAPLTFRGDDPSRWFSTSARSDLSMHGTPGDPDTPLIRTYPGERLRIRLIQGSHEEQHSFSLHGMRWRRDWGNPASRLVNQQSLGISEAFTLDIDPAADSPYGPGDHLWAFGVMDDLWVGCWGLIRVLQPTPSAFPGLAPLPDPTRNPTQALQRLSTARATPPRPRQDASGNYPVTVRNLVVVARRVEHEYAGRQLTDPWGQTWSAAEYSATEHEQARSSGQWRPSRVQTSAEPLVLRARRGEWIRLFCVNELLGDGPADQRDLPRFGAEPSPPRLPLEHLDELSRPDRRKVSPRVSLHASLLSYDVTGADGANIGRNADGTVAPLRTASGDHDEGHAEEGGELVHRSDHHGAEPNWTEYWWYADEALAPATQEGGPGQVCYLQDMADVRDHRHHGLVGALVVEPGDVEPYRRGSTATEPDGWTGVSAELRTADGTAVASEVVVFIQDGLRLFVGGHPELPVPDIDPTDDPEDSGQKALSYRWGGVSRGVPPTGDAARPLATVAVGLPLWLRVVGAGDKPRQHSLTVHGLAWPSAPWVPGSSWTGALGGVVSGYAEDLVLQPTSPGDHGIRSGAFRWGTELGVWGTLRVTPYGRRSRAGRGGQSDREGKDRR